MSFNDTKIRNIKLQFPPSNGPIHTVYIFTLKRLTHVSGISDMISAVKKSELPSALIGY